MNGCSINDNLDYQNIFKDLLELKDPNKMLDIAVQIGNTLRQNDTVKELFEPSKKELAIAMLTSKLQESVSDILESVFLDVSPQEKEVLLKVLDNSEYLAYCMVEGKVPDKANEINSTMLFTNSPNPEENSDYIVKLFAYSQLYDLYRSAQASKALMEKAFKFGLISSFLVNFRTGLLVKGLDHLNSNIALFKQLLADTITEYYCQEKGIPNIETQRIFLFDDSGNYIPNSKDRVKLKALDLFKDFNEDKLNDLFYHKSDNKSNLALRAFNAWVMLNNFDMLAKHIMGDTLQIGQNDINVEKDVSYNKYKIVDKSGLVKTWRNSEDINAISEFGNISTLLIESIPLYEFNPNAVNDSGHMLLSDQNVTLADFAFAFQQVMQHTAFKNLVQDVKSNMGKKIPELIDAVLSSSSSISFGANTNLVKNILYSVKRAIYDTNYRAGEFSLFRIMRDDQNTSDFVVGKYPNYMNYISAIIDKTVRNVFINYEYDFETKGIKITESRDTTASNRELSVMQAIDNQNMALMRIPGEVKRLAQIYKVTPKDSPTSGQIYIDIPASGGSKFRIELTNKVGSDARADSNNYIRQISYVPVNGDPITVYYTYNKDEHSREMLNEFATDRFNNLLEVSLRRFADDMINLNFSSNPELLKAFARFLPSKLEGQNLRELTNLEALIELIPLCAKVAVKHNIESNPELSEIDPTSGKFRFIKSSTDLNKFYNGVDITNKSTNPKTADGICLKPIMRTIGDRQLLRALALARMLLNGELSKGTVKNIEGNSVATNGLMNLTATTFIGWNDSKRRLELEDRMMGNYPPEYRECIVRDNLFLRKEGNPFIGYPIKGGAKGQDASKVKPYKKLNSTELMQTALLYDFLKNYGADLQGKPINQGHLLIQPTVYSDKTRNYVVEIDGNAVVNGKKLLNMIAEDYRDAHFNSLRSLYSILLRNLVKDYIWTLLDVLTEEEKSLIRELMLSVFPDKNYRIYHLFVDENGIFNRLNKLFAINPNGVSFGELGTFKTAKELYRFLSAKNNTELINNIHFDDSEKKNLKENQVLKHYFRMFTGPIVEGKKHTEYYDHIIDRNKLRFALEAVLLDLFYQEKEDPDPIIDNAFNRIARNIGGTLWETAKEQLINSWVDPTTGKLIVAKINGLPVTKLQLLSYNISLITDNNQRTNTTILLNPILDAFWAADVYISQEYINSTVGGCYVHKNNFKSLKFKDEIDRLEEEDAGRYLSLFKRMVIFPATMHPLHQEVLEGTATYYNIACIEDEEAPVWDYKNGLKGDGIDSCDGSGFCTPFVSELENGSLLGAHAGDVKKPIGHWFNDAYGTSSLFKYALFPISNERIREASLSDTVKTEVNGGSVYTPKLGMGDPRIGVDFRKILYKMTNASWYDVIEKNFNLEIDITKKFNGRALTVNDLESTYYYDKDRDVYLKITDIKRVGKDLYLFTRVLVDNLGKEILNSQENEVFYIDNTYALWQALGGEWSMSIQDGRLIADESSVRNVVVFMNNVGFVRSTDNPVGMQFIRDTKLAEPGVDFTVENGVYNFRTNLTQREVFQPLKYAGIHYIANKSAVKSGQTNINSRMSWYDDTPLRSKRMSTSNFGIQMDADHHADDSELSEMTQVISALEANGWAHDVAKMVYEDLGNIVAQSMKSNTQALKTYFQTGNTQEIYRILGKALLNAYADEESGKANLTDAIIRNLLKEIEKSGDIVGASQHLPMSNNDIMNDIVKTVTSKINKSAIKRKYAGMGAVMVPAYNLIKVHKIRDHKGNLIDTLQSRATKKGINSMLDTFSSLNPVVESANLDLGGSYIITDESGNPLLEYTLNGKTYYLTERFNPTTLLISLVALNSEDGSYNTEVSAYIENNPEILSKYHDDIDQIKRLQFIDRHNQEGDSMMVNEEDIRISELLKQDFNFKLARIELNTLDKYYSMRGSSFKFREDFTVGRNLQPARTTFRIGGQLFNIFDVDAVKDRMVFNQFLQDFKDNVKTYDLNTLISTLDSLLLNSRISTRTLELKSKVSQYITSPISESEKREYIKRYLELIDTELEKGVIHAFKAVYGKFEGTDSNKNYKVSINGVTMNVDPGSVLMRAAELVMSKAYATKFGIRKGDNVSDIDFKYFYDLLLRNFRTIPTTLYDVVLRRSNGRHAYIVLKSNKSMLVENGLQKVDPSTYTDPVTQETVRLDEDTKEEISSWNDCELYKDALGNEFIVTDDIAQFTEDDTFTSWSLNPYVNDKEDAEYRLAYERDIYEISKLLDGIAEVAISTGLVDISTIEEGPNRNANIFRALCLALQLVESILDARVKAITDYLTAASDKDTAIISDEDATLLSRYVKKSLNNLLRRTLTPEQEKIIDTLKKTKLPKVEYYDFKKHLSQAANKKLVSFQQSLNVVAARIPSQSLQSFMTMKVVGFTESEENRAYVSHFQAYLQGSDYDIDKVYLMGSEFTEDGTYIGWSPLFNFYSIKTLEKSQEFPIPNGTSYEVIQRQQGTNFLPENSVDISNYVEALYAALLNMETVKKNSQNRQEIENSVVNYLDLLKKLLIFVQNLPNIKLYIDALNKDQGFQNFAKNMEKLINSHTEYLTKIKSKDKLLKITKNSVTARILLISNMPENTYAAYSPIEMDTSREAATYSTMGENERQYNTMNTATKFHMMEQNMMGKDGIGIAAVGVKVLFALLFYYNEALRHDVSEIDSPEFKRLRNAFFEKNFKGLCQITKEINLDEARNIIANVNWEGEVGKSIWKKRILSNIELLNQNIGALQMSPLSEEERIVEEARLEFLKEIIQMLLEYMKDSSLVNSSLLSAATDNAKELILAKINANPDLMKVYLYGIIVGIDFNDIAALMTSPTVNAITKLSGGNIFSEYDGNITLDKALRKILSGPDLDTYIPYSWRSVIEMYPSNVDALTPNNKLIKLLDIFAFPKYMKGDDNAISLVKDLKNVRDDLGGYKFIADRYLSQILEIRSLVPTSKADPMIKKTVYQVLDRYEEFLNTLKDIDKTKLDLFLEMLDSAEEISDLGRNLGINQGIRTSLAEKITYLESIESAFKNRFRKIKTSTKVDELSEWCIDHNLYKYIGLYGDSKTSEELKEQIRLTVFKASQLGILEDFNVFNFVYDPEYQEVAVDMYDLIKSSINRLDVIRTVPHFKAMVQTAVDDFMLFDRCISKFDMLYNFAHKFNAEGSQGLSNRTKERFYRNMQSYIDAKIITKFFKDNKNEDVITSIPINTGQFITKNWKMLTVYGEHIIDLSTMEGLATFKLWMETVVIPNLKQGYRDDLKTLVPDITLSLNSFILDLMINSTDRTTTGHRKYLYTLPINMMDTESEFGKNMLIRYTSAFNKITSRYNGIPIQLLFFYYNLIVNRGAMGLQSLSPIFKDAVSKNNGDNELNKFFQWEGTMDSLSTLTSDDIDYMDMMLSCAIEMPRSFLGMKKAKGAKFPMFIKVRNYETGYYDIYKWDPNSIVSDNQLGANESELTEELAYELMAELLDNDLDWGNTDIKPIGYVPFHIGPYGQSIGIDEIIDLMPYLTVTKEFSEVTKMSERLLRLLRQGKILVYNNC